MKSNLKFIGLFFIVGLAFSNAIFADDDSQPGIVGGQPAGMVSGQAGVVQQGSGMEPNPNPLGPNAPLVPSNVYPPQPQDNTDNSTAATQATDSQQQTQQNQSSSLVPSPYTQPAQALRMYQDQHPHQPIIQ